MVSQRMKNFEFLDPLVLQQRGTYLLPSASPSGLTDSLEGTVSECFWGEPSEAVPQFDSCSQWGVLQDNELRIGAQRAFARDFHLAGKNPPIRTFCHLLTLVENFKLRNWWCRGDLLEVFDCSAYSSCSRDSQHYEAVDLARGSLVEAQCPKVALGRPWDWYEDFLAIGLDLGTIVRAAIATSPSSSTGQSAIVPYANAKA